MTNIHVDGQTRPTIVYVYIVCTYMYSIYRYVLVVATVYWLGCVSFGQSDQTLTVSLFNDVTATCYT